MAVEQAWNRGEGVINLEAVFYNAWAERQRYPSLMAKVHANRLVASPETFDARDRYYLCTETAVELMCGFLSGKTEAQIYHREQPTGSCNVGCQMLKQRVNLQHICFKSWSLSSHSMRSLLKTRLAALTSELITDEDMFSRPEKAIQEYKERVSRMAACVVLPTATVLPTTSQ